MTNPSSPPSSTPRTCVGGGYLVAPVFRIPDNPAYFQTPGPPFIVGCNQLRCTLCGSMGRHQVGFRDGPDAHKNTRAIYDEPDWSKSPFLAPSADSRFYSCACSLVVLAAHKAVLAPNGVWTCQGHPAPDNGGVLPTMLLDTAINFVVLITNSHIQQTLSLIALTFTDATCTTAFPAHFTIGAQPGLKIWTPEHQQSPIDVDFAKVAGACVKLKDNTIQTF